MEAVTVDLPGSEEAESADESPVERSFRRSGITQSLRVTFSDLEYLVQHQANKSEKLAILKGVSGFCNPGMHLFRAPEK